MGEMSWVLSGRQADPAVTVNREDVPTRAERGGWRPGLGHLQVHEDCSRINWEQDSPSLKELGGKAFFLFQSEPHPAKGKP